MNKIKSISISKLFKNNKFLLLFSFVMACVLWLFFSQNTGEAFTATIHDLPISIELSKEAQEDGLKIFSGGDTLASVMISGNRITVGSVTKDDIQVVAQQAANTITVPNTYNLELTAKKNGVKADYEILSVTPSTVSVVVDRLREKELTLTDSVSYDYKVDSTYYAGKPIYSVDRVTVSGPQAEVNKVSQVAIEGGFTGDLSSSASKDFQLKLYDETGVEIKSELLTTNVENNSITVTIPVMPKKEVPVQLQFTNIPDGIDTDSFASVEPDKITIAGPQDTISSLNAVSIQTIDFSEITPESDSLTLPIELPSACINISNAHNAKVTLNLSGYSHKSIAVSDFKVKNIESGYDAVVTTSSIFIDVMGPENVIESLTADNLQATIDLSNMGAAFVGTTEIPVSVKLTGVERCWVYNTQNNTAIISVTKSDE